MENYKGIVGLLLHEKPAKIILGLKDPEKRYASALSKEANCTYTHTLKILTELEKHGVVKFKKSGRVKDVELTDVGVDIAHLLEGLLRHLEKVAGEKEPVESK